MFREDDENTLCRLLGVTELPEPLHETYQQRLRMYHRIASGPLPLPTLIEIACLAASWSGVEADDSEQSEEWGAVSDWNAIEVGTAVRVKLGGQLVPGIFRGLAKHGLVTIETANREKPAQCQRRNVLVRVDEPALA